MLGTNGIGMAAREAGRTWFADMPQAEIVQVDIRCLYHIGNECTVKKDVMLMC